MKTECFDGFPGDLYQYPRNPVTFWACSQECYIDDFKSNTPISLLEILSSDHMFFEFNVTSYDSNKYNKVWAVFYYYDNIPVNTHRQLDQNGTEIEEEFALNQSAPSSHRRNLQQSLDYLGENVVCSNQQKQLQFEKIEAGYTWPGLAYFGMYSLYAQGGFLKGIRVYTQCVTNCLVCDTQTSCAICAEGYSLVPAYYNPLFPNDMNCDTTYNFAYLPNCQRITDQSICTVCFPGYAYINQSDNNSCEPIWPNLPDCESNEYRESETSCVQYSKIAYIQEQIGDNYVRVTRQTDRYIQEQFRCPQGTLVVQSRIDNYENYTCRCFVANCAFCTSNNSCDRCLIGYEFHAQTKTCEKVSIERNSFHLSALKTEKGFEVRAKFDSDLVYSKLDSTNVEITISNFNSFNVLSVGFEDKSTILVELELLAKAKHKTLTLTLKDSMFISQNLLTNFDDTIPIEVFVLISDSEKEAAENAKNAGLAASSAIASTLLIIVIISNFSAVVSTIDLTGFLYYLLYIEARFPVNIVAFYGVFKNFQLDFIPNPFTDLVSTGYMQLSAVRFMQSDTDAYFLTSTGQSVTIFLIIVVMYLTAKILAKLELPLLSKYFQKSVYETWEYGGYFDAVWTIYIYLLIGVLMQFQGFDCSDSSCGWNYFIFSISFIVSFGVPALIFKLIRGNANLKDDEYQKTKLSSIIAGVRLYSVKECSEITSDASSSEFAVWREKYSKQMTKYYMPILYLRKIIFAFIIVCLSASGYTQLTLITLLNIAMALYFLVLRPLESRYENYKGAISEIVMIVFQILVGILIEDPESQEEEDRINIGWVAIAIISFVILWHTVGIIFDFLVATYQAFKAMVSKKTTPEISNEAENGEEEDSKNPKLKVKKSSQVNKMKNDYENLNQLEGKSICVSGEKLNMAASVENSFR